MKLNLEKRNETSVIGLGLRVLEKIDEGIPAGVEEEVLVFSKLSPKNQTLLITVSILFPAILEFAFLLSLLPNVLDLHKLF